MQLEAEDNLNKLLFTNDKINILLSSIHLLFEKQLENSTNNIAVSCGNYSISYKELNYKSNQLANYLLSLQIEKENVIGIILERGINIIISLLAVLKAGYAFLLIDKHSLPPNRIELILNDSQPNSFIIDNITYESNLDFLDNLSFTNLINIDKIDFDILNKKNSDLKIDGHSLAYVMYTSGTTNEPKKVSIEYAGLLNTLLNQIEIINIKPTDRVLCAASLSFDAFLWEIGGALLAGAHLFLTTEEERSSIKKLSKFIANKKITIATLIPSVIRLIPKNDFRFLEKLISVGELCTPDLLEKVPMNCLFYNAYGLSETSICLTIGLCCKNSPTSNIGKPIQNVKIHVLDEKLHFVTPGEVGILYAGGICLAREYRKYIVRNNFVTTIINGEYFYNTGDLVRLRNDGSLDYIGRTDDQLKICGKRVNINEIHYQLIQHPFIKKCLVTKIFNSISNRNKIVALIETDNKIIHYKEIRKFLAHNLPSYMIPSKIIKVEKLPLTASGKLKKTHFLEEATYGL